MVADEWSRGGAARIECADHERAHAFGSSGTFRSTSAFGAIARTICAAQIEAEASLSMR